MKENQVNNNIIRFVYNRYDFSTHQEKVYLCLDSLIDTFHIAFLAFYVSFCKIYEYIKISTRLQEPMQIKKI